MLHKTTELIVSQRRSVTTFFNRVTDQFERKFDGFPATVDPAISAASSESAISDVDMDAIIDSISGTFSSSGGDIPPCPDSPCYDQGNAFCWSEEFNSITNSPGDGWGLGWNYVGGNSMNVSHVEDGFGKIITIPDGIGQPIFTGLNSATGLLGPNGITEGRLDFKWTCSPAPLGADITIKVQASSASVAWTNYEGTGVLWITHGYQTNTVVRLFEPEVVGSLLFNPMGVKVIFNGDEYDYNPGLVDSGFILANAGVIVSSVNSEQVQEISVDYLRLNCGPVCTGGEVVTQLLTYAGGEWEPGYEVDYYIDVWIDGAKGVRDDDYTVCGNNICGPSSEFTVTARYVVA